MFFLISFVIAKNYCIGQQTEEQCKNICKDFNGNFDDIFIEIPTELELNTDTNEKHTFYIANNVSYTETNQELIFCDQSLHLIYANPGSQIKVKDHVYLNSNKILIDVPILFKYNNNNYYYPEIIKIDVETDEQSDIKPINFEVVNGNYEISFKFLTCYIPEKLISISSNSKKIRINEITSQVQKIVSNTEMLSEQIVNYYCVSDKEEKCSDYSSKYQLTEVDSISDANDYSNNIIIVDTSVPQFLQKYNNNYYTHIIALPNSDVTFYQTDQNSDFYIILHEDSIEMPNFYFEGKGNLTFETCSKFYLMATSKTNNNNFTLRNKYLYNQSSSQIYALRNDINIELDKKINVLEYTLFYGPKCLSGLFEKDKFIPSDDGELLLNNITSENLKEYDYEHLTYYFQKGDHEIPKNWKHFCYFKSLIPNETNFIFNDVYSYDGNRIDNFIYVNSDNELSFNMITIRPANYFYLKSFKSYLLYKNIEKYTIQVDKDFVMYGKGPDNYIYDDEISHDQCKIIGNGTISFIDENFMKIVKKFCKIDDEIQLQVLRKNIPNFYVCIGQSDVETCKSKIKNVDSIQNAEWIWLRNSKTIYNLQNNYSIKAIYITDKYEYYDSPYKYNIILTKDSHLTILYSEYYQISLYNDSIKTYGNGYFSITADDSTAQLTVLFTYRSNYYNSRDTFRIYYYQPVTEFNFRYYFNYNSCKMFMKYVNNFTNNSIKLDGKSLIKIREPYLTRLGIFEKSDSIFFTVNKISDYFQICYNDEPVEMEELYDFTLCKDEKDFESAGSATAYIFKSISLNYVNQAYSRNHYFYGNITVFTDLPNNVTFVFNYNYYQIRNDTYNYYFRFNCSETKFIFDIKDTISLDYIDGLHLKPSIDFITSNEQVYIFPYPNISNLKNSLYIAISDKLTVYSPAPNYLEGLFGDHSIEYAENWAYYHLSDEGKSLYGNYPSNLFTDIENDEHLPKNIVLAVGPTDTLTVPLNWLDMHNVYIYQDIKNDLLIDKPLNISYTIDGVVFNHKMKIVAGFFKANVPNLFTVNSYLLQYYYIENYPYKLKIDITENTHTDLYVGIIYYSYIYNSNSIISIYNQNPNNSLTINATNAANMSEFKYLSSTIGTFSKILYYIDYDYICYYPYFDHSFKCPGSNYNHINDVTTLYEVVTDYPELTILVAYDMNIPYTTGENFRLMPLNENIQFDLPYSPESMTISENVISFNYSDSSYLEILNTSSIEVALTDSFKLIVNSSTESKISFTLNSNVFVSAEVNCNADIDIDVYKNSYHLYTEDIDQFGNIMKEYLDIYRRVCACESETESFCTFSRKDSIEKIFFSPFLFNEVEIAPSSTEKEIYLPSILNPVLVYVLPYSSELTIRSISNLHITNNNIFINELWNFEGDIGVLKFKLDKKAYLSITEQITTPIVLQLTSDQTYIDLKNCVSLYNSSITIIKHGNNPNEITVFGSNETFFNFTSNLGNHDDIKIIHNGTQKYLCICDSKTCNKCSEGIEGIVEKSNKIRSDPGENVKIRVFSDFEMSSNIFNNDHDVFIDEGCMLNLTNIDTVDQNLDDGIKVDKLRFFNASNILIKPNEISLNIKMRKKEEGQHFTIEMDTFLRLNVTNIEEDDIQSSRLYVNGIGELNCYDYPFEKIRPTSKIRVIKGVYIICGASEGSDICSYKSVERYLRLGHSHDFEFDFDYNSKILVFLDSYTSCLYAHLRYLHNQKVQFIRKTPKKSKLLEEKEPVKLKFLSTTELVNKEDSTTGLFNEEGGTLLDNSDSDLFVVGFDENLIIKQEGNSTSEINTITIQPMSDKGTVFIDDSVDIKNQKIKIESENNKKVSLTIRTNQNVSEEELNKYIESDKSSISIDFDSPLTPKRKGFPIGAIVGILVGVIAVVAVIIVIVIFLVKQKKLNNVVLSENVNDLSDSTF